VDTSSTEDGGGAQVFEVATPGGPMVYAIADDGMIFLNGDLHPHGAPQAMTEAMREGVEWIGLNAVQTLYPLPWLLAKADGTSPERVLLIASIERFIRGRG
jgi:hypothetical protein